MHTAYIGGTDGVRGAAIHAHASMVPHIPGCDAFIVSRVLEPVWSWSITTRQVASYGL